MIRIAAMGDIHCWEGGEGHFRPIFAGVDDVADVLLLAGDLTVMGKAAEAETLMNELSDIKVPMIAVLGNHDCEDNDEQAIISVLQRHNVVVLDGDNTVLTIDGKTVGFAGAKGFCGGFDKYAVAPFGEQSLKDFVFASVREAYRLEEALSELTTDYRVVLLHYSPIRETVVGEPLELWPFLGSSVLCKPVDALGASLVIHAHAHYGSPSGTTKTGIPVFNVARTVIKSYFLYNLE